MGNSKGIQWSKKSFDITKARAEESGLKAYVWRTSEDQRVRKSHANMEGVIVFWADPPNPEELIGEKSLLGKYHGGECEGCRCYPESIVLLDLVNWPSRVYYKGKIQTMTKEEFKIIFNSKN